MVGEEAKETSQELLPAVKPPFLPPLAPAQAPHTLTLVMDLDETLIHYKEEENAILVRPGANQFLKVLSKYYEIVVFTAALQDYADWAIDYIDPDGCVKYRLYRQHTTFSGGGFIKDLSKLGRDIKKVIIVDNVKDNFQLQEENGIWIKSWDDDLEDNALFELCQLLKRNSRTRE
eukprot:TRINITY_DN3620_c0_g5_i1.p2 TRINITY_DN3620_c0_g5~~TRINITY_DN3620_c0_g5_i1.p2  ORF type:complete len:175 (-),score=40.94 TRINITY_DN3620_c0_g5_i1:150-674(-)